MSFPHQTLALRPRVQLAEECVRPTRAEVDLGAIAHNLAVMRAHAAGAQVLAVVKADAYGHGVVPVALRLQQEGVDGFGVALAEEGLELRDAGIRASIIVLNGVYGGAHREVLARGLTPVVYELDELHAFARAARGERFGIHLKIDTGMARLGVPLAELDAFLDGLERVRGVHVEGLMTHLACADEPGDGYTAEQLARFATARARVAARGHRPSVIHAANTAAAMRYAEARFDMVRPGIGLFGISPVGSGVTALRPAMRLRSEIIAMRELPAGAQIGYGGSFRTARPSRIATVPLGYGDGLLRATSNRGSMLVRGLYAPIAGNVSMDLTTLDVTDVPGASTGDEVVLLGEQQGARIDAEDIAAAAGTIAYEVLTNVSRRVPRFYK